MLNHDDLKWVAATATELNTMLQRASRYADLSRQHKGEQNYVEMLGEQVEIATKTAQALFDRVTASILERSTNIPARSNKMVPLPFTVVAPPSPSIAALGHAMAQAAPKLRGETAQAPFAVAAVATLPPPDLDILNPGGNRELILIVEDEQEVAVLASQILTAEDYRVILAKDGFEALKIYQQAQDQIGLIILDFFLPVIDGDAVFDELRALNPKVNVVLSSGFAEQTKLGAMLALGLRGFIPEALHAGEIARADSLHAGRAALARSALAGAVYR